MINYETILSSYDDKLTLMQWLKKVEAALKDASATSFHVNKRGNATITFSIDFENGETLESEPLVLQQGESVASGEIRNGHLFLTLTNGDELDCGALFNGEVPSLNVRSLEVSGGLLLGDDANAAIGGDLVVRGLTEVENIKAYGDVETESLTAAGDEISAKKPVVEVMTGYSAQISEGISENITLTPIYAGVVKNGNKITFCLFAKVNFAANSGNTFSNLFNFNIPASMGARITPYPFSGSNNRVETKEQYLAKSSIEGENIPMWLNKDSNTMLTIGCYVPNSATKETDLIFRFEVTLLLSENLAA